MNWPVTIQPHGWHFDAPDDQALATAAREAGIALRTSCRNGTCRACLCRLLDGQVRFAIEWPGLSREEKAAGWILPCVALAESALVIDAPLAAKKD